MGRDLHAGDFRAPPRQILAPHNFFAQVACLRPVISYAWVTPAQEEPRRRPPSPPFSPPEPCAAPRPDPRRISLLPLLTATQANNSWVPKRQPHPSSDG